MDLRGEVYYKSKFWSGSSIKSSSSSRKEVSRSISRVVDALLFVCLFRLHSLYSGGLASVSRFWSSDLEVEEIFGVDFRVV